YDDEKAQLKKDLNAAPGKISLILDCWTSKNFFSFHGIIASWISESWEYKETLIGMDILNGNHSGKTLAESLFKVINEFGIADKILGVTTDNAANCDTMFKEFASECENI
ncbi:unnamed protein product, partial [Allacma fusca]